MTCEIEGCERPSFCRGWCSMHYSRWQRHGDLGPAESSYNPDQLCSVDGCERTVQGRGWCGQHYARWRKTGDPIYVPPTLMDRAMAKIRKRPDGCWEWTGARAHGYGRINVDKASRLAHRVVYELLVGPIPDGLTLDHLCRRPECVNPAHLDPVPLGVNTARAPMAISTLNRAKTHCPQGHPYDEANTLIRANGNRVCRQCNRDRSRAAHERRKAARSTG